MKRSNWKTVLLPVLTGLVVMAGCAGPAGAAAGPGARRPDVRREYAGKSEQSRTGEKEQSEESDDNTAVRTAGDSLKELTSQVRQAWEAQGFTWKETDTGDGSHGTVLKLESQDQPVLVQIIQGAGAPKAFDRQCAADEDQNMQVMEEWTQGAMTVRVIRNNRANANFIEALDTNQNVTIHVANTLPEQLTPSLQALQALGWPVKLAG